MISEDKLAAATLAQIFGSELTKIDSSTTHRSANTPNAVQLNPKQILLGGQQQTPSGRLISELQNEAENAFPYQAPVAFSTPQQTNQIQLPLNGSNNVSNQPATISSEHLERICVALEKIAKTLESSETFIKKSPRYRSENK